MQPETEVIRVIAAVVDGKQLTLYKEDGNTVIIKQGDPRLAEIVKVIAPILALNDGSTVEVDLGEPEVETNTYREYQEKFGGKVSFFKIARHRLAGIFQAAAHAILPSAEPVKEQVLGTIPVPDNKPTGIAAQVYAAPAAPAKVDAPAETKAEKLLAATNEIIANALPVTDPSFTEKGLEENGEETVVAVVGDTVIADVEKLKPQLQRAVDVGSAKGMEAFMKRVAAVATQRRHSVQDLLKFLEKGDLPIADDGCIVIYKVLQTRNGDKSIFYDCYTGRVPQKVGSFVCMSPSLVDHDRTNQCSNGLHVARRQYLRGFGGDVMVMAKVRPEDVIAVPSYDANKMRVCGYHILFQLSDEVAKTLRNDSSFKDNEEAKLLLGRALVGDHPQPIERVEITQHMGNGVVITPLLEPPTIDCTVELPTIEAPAENVALLNELCTHERLGDETDTGVEEEEDEDTVEGSDRERCERCGSLMDDSQIGLCDSCQADDEEKAEVKPAEPLEPVAPKETKLDAPKVDPKAIAKEVTAIKAQVESRADKAKRLYEELIASEGREAQKAAAQALLDHKKAVKLGWTALGLDADMGDQLKPYLD